MHPKSLSESGSAPRDLRHRVSRLLHLPEGTSTRRRRNRRRQEDGAKHDGALGLAGYCRESFPERSDRTPSTPMSRFAHSPRFCMKR
ncbi:MAG: hypothetical protein QOD10_6054 [Mycobacterium sp.]|jgi:hypothetical protein|nr:hypothetical protein [Mycobacterium sp.]